MFNKLKFVFILCLIQLCFLRTEAISRPMEEAIEHFTVMISNLHKDLDNLSSNTYRISSEEVQTVLRNNSQELSRTNEMLTQLDKHSKEEIQTAGLKHMPHKTKYCRDENLNKIDIISRYIKESENVCLVFIADVFSLIENEALYENITNTKIFIDEFNMDCGNRTTPHEAEICFRREIRSVQQIIKDLKNEVDYFLTNARVKASRMSEYLHRCYDTVRRVVLNKKVRDANREFSACVENILRNDSN